ncbi:PREDICTED: uncharacterized protein LOC104817412 isoform X2 [Tarenaya hassleriana]|uniref:uncharacterized protein LOC104817412 isoform X2 n=1 Tax=Tarenaya hassleriana TaxID=28532 RepID=UPI00053C716D|nr:PREDICTED: uncharacterized protein LOC104817412 isoform X2 [Tarenaya hassleriana]
MEEEGNGSSRKRAKPADKEKKGDSRDGTTKDTTENEETETKLPASEEMELNIAQIHDKIERFTRMTMFKELSDEFEERLVMIHKENVEKWQEEMKELRLLDASNEEATAVLHNARFLLQNPCIDS